MTYGAKDVIPLESGFPTLRTDQFSVEENNCLLLDSLDVAEERREVAMVKMVYYQQKLKIFGISKCSHQNGLDHPKCWYKFCHPFS